MNTLVQRYREQFPDDDRSDIDLIVELGAEASKRGILEKQPEDFRRDYQRVTDAMAPDMGEAFSTGVKRGVRGLGSTALGFGALVADWLPGTATDKYVRDPLLRETQSLEAPREGEAKQLTWDDVTSAKTLASYLAQHTGNALPSVAESLLISAGTLGWGALAKEGVKGLAKSKVRNLMLAQGANSLALSSGEIYSDLANDKDVSEDDARLLATGLGVVAAIPDSILPTYVASKFIKPAVDEASKKAQRNFLVALGKEAFKTVPTEAGTEAFQEWVNVTAGKIGRGEGLDLSEQDWKQLREAAVGGAAGGVISAPVAAFGEVRNTDAPPAATASAPQRRVAAPLVEDEAQSEFDERADMRRRVIDMSDDDAKLRYAALEKLTAPTALEKAEKDLISGMFATQWKQAATPPPAPAPSAPTETPAPAQVAPPAPAPVAPEDATPETPVAAVKPPERLTATQVMQRTERISNRLLKLVERGADVREVKRLQAALLETGELTNRAGLDAVEAALEKAEMDDVAIRAKVKAGDAKLLSSREKEIEANRTALLRQKKDAASAIRREIEAKRQDIQMAKLTEQLKKLYPTETPQGPDSGAGSAPNTGSGVETAPAPVVFTAGRLVDPVTDFSTLTLEEAQTKDWEAAFAGAFKKGPLKGKMPKGSGQRTTGSNASQTTIGVALLDPKTGKVHLRGLKTDMSVQGMAREIGSGKNRTKALSLEPWTGKKVPMSLKEVTQAGLIPRGYAHFDNAGRIEQDFDSMDDYWAAAESTEMAAVNVEENEAKQKAQAEADAKKAATPVGAKAVAAAEKRNAKRGSAQEFTGDAADNNDPAKALEEKEEADANLTEHGVGPWVIMHGSRVVTSGLKLADVKKILKAPAGKETIFSQAMEGKSGTFAIVDAKGEPVHSVQVKRATKRKAPAATEVIKDEDVQQAYAWLSEVVDIENEKGDVIGKSLNAAEALFNEAKKGDVAKVVKDFLQNEGDFGVEGGRYIELLGGYRKATDVISAVISQYESLAAGPTGDRSRTGGAQSQSDSGAGAGGGSVVPAKRGGKSGSRKAKDPARKTGEGADDSQRRAGNRGEAGVAVGPAESDLDGRLTEVELKDAAIRGIYKATSIIGNGVFSDTLLTRFPANVREAVTDLLAERGMEWDDFQSYIQSAFDASNDADDFLAIMRGSDTKASVEPDIIVYRAVKGDADPLQPRSEYGILSFASNRDVAESYSNVPRAARAFRIKGKLVEFKTERDGSLNKIAFDKAAQSLKDGEVLVARNTWDPGPWEHGPDALQTYRTDVYATRDPSTVESADRADYERIQAEMQQLGHDKVGTPAYNELWQQSEGIKNRYEGDVPPKYGEATPAFTPVGGYGVLNVVNPLTGRLESPFAAPDTIKAIEHNAAEAERRAKQSRVDESSPASIEWTDAPPPDQSLQRRLNEIAQDLSEQNAKDSRRQGLRASPPVRITAQNPLDSGSSGRGVSEFVRAAELIGKAFKKRVVFVRIEGGPSGLVYRGLTNRASDVILINVISGVSTLKLIGHELTHNLKFQKPDLYRTLASHVLVNFPPPAGYRQQQIDAGYNAGEVNEEWVSDIVGENFADPEFWKNFKAQAKTEEQNIQLRNLATYIGGWVSRIFQSFKRVLNRHSAEVVQAAKLQKVIAEVMSQYAGADQFAEPMLQESGDILKSAAFIGEDGTEERMRIDAAAINEVLPVLEEAHRALAPNEAFDKFIESVMWKGDSPEKRLTRIEKIVRGTRQTRLSDLSMGSRHQAAVAAYIHARKLETDVRAEAAEVAKRITDRSDEVTKLGKKVLKVERGYQDASLMNAHFHEQLKELITGVARDDGRKASAAARLGELTQAVRMLESMEDGASIPLEYQRVFERIATSDTTSVFDHMQALAKLNLPLTDLSVKGIFDAMGSSGVPALVNLTATNKPLAVALAALARTNQKEMDLLQVRVMIASNEKMEARRILDDISTANDERLDALWVAYEKMLKSTDVFSRLAARFIRDRRMLRTKQTDLRKLARQESLLNDFARRLEEKRLELGKETGDFATWAAVDRGTYSAMRQNKEGKWVEVKRTLHLSGAAAEANGEQLHRDVAANRAWLEMHAHLKGTPLYNSIEAQWQQLSKINFLNISRPAHRWFADRFLASMSERFRLMGGVAPVAVAQMLQRYQFITRQGSSGGRTWHDTAVAMAKRYEVALMGVTKAAGYHAPQLFTDEVRDHVIAYLESQDGKDLDSAMRGASRVARRYIPSSNVIAEDFAEKLGEYIRRLDEIDRFFLKVAEENGTYVEDAHIKGWMRKAMPRGAITVSRRIRVERLLDAVEALDAAKWEGNPFVTKDEEGNATGDFNMDGMSVFTDDVMRLVIIPFIMKPGQPLFFGADKTDGDWSYLSQVDAQRAWESSDKTVESWIDRLFDATYAPGADANPTADRAAYQMAMYSRLSGHAQFLRNIHRESTEKNPHTPEGAMPLPHRLQDGRKNDALPPEFLRYDTFDVPNAEIMLNEIAYHAAFGRDGERVNALLGTASSVGAIENEIEGRVRDYNRLKGVTESDKRRDAAARGWDYKALKTADTDKANFRSLRASFHNRFGLSVGMEQGPERAWWEGLKTISALVLNQPTSGLWNIPTILDFPLVIGGKTGYRSSARAMKDVVKGLVGSPLSALNQALGSPLSALNINLFRMSDYWTLIAGARHGASQELTLKEHMTAIGKDGAYYEGGVANKATQASRFIQNAMKRGFKTKGHLPFNGLWAPFNFIGETVTTAVAVGNVENVEMMVKRAVEFFRHNPDAFNDPTFRLTAKDLQMGGSAYFNDQRAFDYYTSKLTEFHLGTLEDMARGAMGRARILTDEQVMMVAQMSFNEISLESSINSRPMGWVENPVLRYGGLLMGWPLMQMDKTHRALKTVDGRKDYAAIGRGLGVLALWTLPMGLAFSFLMDEWDEEVVGKRSNRRELDLKAALPGVGPLLALATSDRGAGNTFFGMMERATKAGVYGMGMDVVNGMTNIVDSKSGQREFSLDARVLAFSQFLSVADVMRNIIHQSSDPLRGDITMTYESVGRPLFMALGGNGLIQGMQIVSNVADLDITERAIAERIGVGNYLRAAGRDAKVELKAGAGRTSPTPVTVWQRQMYLAAISNDRTAFLEAYRAAVAAARKQGDEDPEGTVLAGWKRRHPLEAVFAHKPTPEETVRIMRFMNDDGRRAVQDVIRAYEDFTYLIEPIGRARSSNRNRSRPAATFR